MSPPAQKAFSLLLRMTTAATLLSSRHAISACVMARTIASDSEFKALGRSSVMKPVPLLTLVWTNSLMVGMVAWGRWENPILPPPLRPRRQMFQRIRQVQVAPQPGLPLPLLGGRLRLALVPVVDGGHLQAADLFLLEAGGLGDAGRIGGTGHGEAHQPVQFF